MKFTVESPWRVVCPSLLLPRPFVLPYNHHCMIACTQERQKEAACTGWIRRRVCIVWRVHPSRCPPIPVFLLLQLANKRAAKYSVTDEAAVRNISFRTPLIALLCLAPVALFPVFPHNSL